MTKRQTTVLISGIVLTALYWVVALWYTNKQAYSKDLVLFHVLFGNGADLDVWQYIYQFGITVLLFLIVPYCIFRFYLKEDFLSLGLRFVPNSEALIVCAVLYPVVLVSTYFSSQDPLIAGEYPLSKGIGASWFVFILYELAYFFYFLSYEIFYRGFFSFGLKTEQGGKHELITIIIVQTLLTTLFHIGKPTPEIAMAAAFGPVFGYVAFRYNSIWYGMVIHYVMNIFIDYFSLHWLHLAPKHFF